MKVKLTKNQLQQSYEKLVISTQLDLDFILLTIAAAAICSFGFRMNSSSVIIGAMVLSPILLTVVAIGASISRNRWKNVLKNFTTLFLSIIIGVTTSFIINNFFPVTSGSEITERILANQADYFAVAFFSGLAGTFAYFWPGIIEAIAGIAISVALIPPVVMVGIGLARWDMPLLTSSLEIVLINVSGITVGSFLLVMGLNVRSVKE